MLSARSVTELVLGASVLLGLLGCSPRVYIHKSFAELARTAPEAVSPIAHRVVVTADPRVVGSVAPEVGWRLGPDDCTPQNDLGVMCAGQTAPTETVARRKRSVAAAQPVHLGRLDTQSAMAGTSMEGSAIATDSSYNRNMATAEAALSISAGVTSGLAAVGEALRDAQVARIAGVVDELGAVSDTLPEGTLLHIHWQAIQTKPRDGSHFYDACAATLYEGVSADQSLAELSSNQVVATVVRATHSVAVVQSRNAPETVPAGYALRSDDPDAFPSDEATKRDGLDVEVMAMCRVAIGDLERVLRSGE